MKIYISLPITGKEALARQRADYLKRALIDVANRIDDGIEVVTPFDIADNLASSLTWLMPRLTEKEKYATYLSSDIKEILSSVDVVYFDSYCPGLVSNPSLGMRLEYQLCKIFEIPRFGYTWSEGGNFSLSQEYLKIK